MTALINAKNFLYRKPAFAINTHTYFFGWRYFYTTCQGVRTFFDNLMQNRSFFPKLPTARGMETILSPDPQWLLVRRMGGPRS